MKILVIIVLYESTLEESIAFQSLRDIEDSNKASYKILLYDNSKCQSTPDLSSNLLIVDYIWNSQNSGVSKAYNVAANYAIQNDFEWLLIADQDTYFPRDIIREYKKAHIRNPDIKLFIPKIRVAPNGKYMSPVKKNLYFTKISKRVPSGVINPSKYGIINSGMLINIDAFWKVGGYNEKVWLDYSDFQFIERFANRYHEAYIINAECIQSFSNENPNVQQKIRRFKLFCSSVKHYQALRIINKLLIGCSVLKRTLSLTYQSRSFKPVLIYFKNYLG